MKKDRNFNEILSFFKKGDFKMLVKTVNYETNYQLPVLIKTKNGDLIKKYRYYSCEFELFKAYRQLKAIKGNIIP